MLSKSCMAVIVLAAIWCHSQAMALGFEGQPAAVGSIKWTVVERIVWAWIFTLPVTGGIAYAIVTFLKAMGWFNAKF